MNALKAQFDNLDMNNLETQVLEVKVKVKQLQSEIELIQNESFNIPKSNCVRLKCHFHTKNYLEMDHKDEYSTGFKMKYNEKTYVITAAHNIEKIKLPLFTTV